LQLDFNLKTLTPAKVKSVLDENDLNFSLQSIIDSEIRVFKYLDHRINRITPYNFVQLFLEILTKNEQLTETKILYVICIYILELVYFEREEVYNSLFKSFTQRDKTANDK
jgi:hypothetical protein